MKKILNFLGTSKLALIMTNYTIACTQKESNNLKQLTDNLTIISKKNITDFKKALIIKLKEQYFEHISIDEPEWEILNKNGKALENDNIAAITEIKIRPKKIFSEKNIKVNWLLESNILSLNDLNHLNTSITFSSLRNISHYTSKLIAAAKYNVDNLNTLTTRNVDILKIDNTSLKDISDIKTSIFKIKAKTNDPTFIGEKVVAVTWNPLILKDLNHLNSFVTLIPLKTIDEFKVRLIEAAKQGVTDLKSLNKNNVDIFEASGVKLTSITDLQNTNFIIKAKTGNKVFIGQKNITVNWNQSTLKNLNKLNMKIEFTSLMAIEDFKNELIKAAKQGVDNFKTLTLNNVDILKDNGEALENLDDIQEPTFMIKAKANNSYYTGQVFVSVSWSVFEKDLVELNTGTFEIICKKNISDFKEKIIIEARSGVKDFHTLTVNNVDILKANGELLNNVDDIKTTIFKIKAKANDPEFTGEKMVSIYFKDISKENDAFLDFDHFLGSLVDKNKPINF